MIIRNALVFTIEDGFVKKDVAIRNGVFSEIADKVLAREGEDAPDATEEVLDGQGCYLIPGLVDIHLHGAVGQDFSDGSMDGVKEILAYELENGITTVCPTTMTLLEEELHAACKNIRVCVEGGVEETEAKICGIHLEGPFISKEKKGAQNSVHIMNPDVKLLERLQEASGGNVKRITVAPETEGAMEFIEKVSDTISVSLGHTACNYECAKEAFTKGAAMVTHLYNGMPDMGHREPGVVGAAFDIEDVMCELICDGLHVHPAVVRATFRQLGKERIVLISDSIRGTGMPDGEYTLGGQPVTVKNKEAKLSDGTIAGSVCNLMDCVRSAVEMGISLETAVYCATYTPAKAIGVEEKYGSIAVGKCGDCVLLDSQDLSICKVIKEGTVVE